jgi:hypothetical protein
VGRETAPAKSAFSGPNQRRQNVELNWMLSERVTVAELPWLRTAVRAWWKLRTVLPLHVGIRDSVVQLVSN